MRKHIAALVVVVSCMTAFAESETIDGITWYYTVSNKCAYIGRVLSSVSGDITIPSTLGRYVVAGIEKDVFKSCTSITSVKIPEGVRHIGRYSFYNCTKLQSVELPASLEELGNNAFLMCSQLTEVHVCSPSHLREIGNGAFCYCDLRSFTVPASTRSIGDAAFSCCMNLSDLQIQSGVTNIGFNAFGQCQGLESIVIPESVVTMGSGMLADCRNLRQITIPFVGSEIGNTGTNSALLGWMFEPSHGNLDYGDRYVARQYFNSTQYGEYLIPKTLTDVKITKETVLGTGALMGCRGLLNVEIPECVTNIGERAFSGCSGLTCVKIPNGVTGIGDAAFSNCTRVTTFRFEGNAPMMNGTGHFASVPSACTAYVYPGSTRWGVTIPGRWKGINIEYLKSVVFDANGGTVTADARWFVDGEAIGVLPIPMWTGYTFDGWYTTAIGGTKIEETTTVFADMTCYAVWHPFPPVFVPGSGTTFDDSLAVSISSEAEGAIIHYTTDGSVPTADSPVYRRFRINGKTIVKAVAEKNGMLSDVVTAEYALGQCDNPVITPSDGATFEWSGEQVSISWQGEDGVLRYTTDGSDPTPTSPIYEGMFTINDSTVIKAKAFGDQFFDSAVVTANITRVWMNVATPVVDAATSFTGSKTKVSISCATAGAVVRYTLNGNEPNSHSTKYTGPFYVTDSCTVKAYATKADYLASAVVTQAVEKVWNIGDTMGKPDHEFTTGGNGGGAGWIRVVDATAPNGEAMKSGAITHNQQSVLETKVMGPGTLTFSWRSSCEDSGGQYDWDHAEFAVDGTVLLWRDGINSWTNETVRIDGVGEHTVMWTYKKDDVESDGDDAAYVAGYGWTADYTETKTTSVPVPYVWLLQHDPEIVDEFEAYETAAKATAANGYNKVWECYVAGISPTNETARFTAAIEMVDGVPQITWSPDLNTNGIERTYTIWGKTNLTDGVEWECPTNSAHRFFKVTVEMP